MLHSSALYKFIIDIDIIGWRVSRKQRSLLGGGQCRLCGDSGQRRASVLHRWDVRTIAPRHSFDGQRQLRQRRAERQRLGKVLGPGAGHALAVLNARRGTMGVRLPMVWLGDQSTTTYLGFGEGLVQNKILSGGCCIRHTRCHSNGLFLRLKCTKFNLFS